MGGLLLFQLGGSTDVGDVEQDENDDEGGGHPGPE